MTSYFVSASIRNLKKTTVKKVKLYLCHEGVLVEWMYSSTPSLTSALDGREWSASRSGRFTPRERVPGTHWIRGWVGPRAVLDAVVKRKIPSTRRPARSPALYRLSYHGSTFLYDEKRQHAENQSYC
jgi:hypothetical protein